MKCSTMEPAKSKFRSRRFAWIAALLSLAATCFFLFTRSRLHREKDGWVADYSFSRIACQVCSGFVERLECQGRPVPLPRQAAPKEGGNVFILYTPVGVVRTRFGDNEYRPYHWMEQAVPESSESITIEELARGWYEGINGQESPRKKGTPAHWCLGIGNKHVRWLDPALIGGLSW